jgi:hypothetical protein
VTFDSNEGIQTGPQDAMNTLMWYDFQTVLLIMEMALELLYQYSNQYYFKGEEGKQKFW